MLINWTIDPETRLVRLKYEGSADFHYWKAVMLEIFAHPSYRPGFGFVADLEYAEVPNQEHLRRVSDFVAAHQKELKGGRWANVTREPAHYGMTRMAQVFVEDSASLLRIFDNTDEAERWASGNGADV